LHSPTDSSELTDSEVQHSHFGRAANEVDTKPTPKSMHSLLRTNTSALKSH
jgi:hypothetical protein